MECQKLEATSRGGLLHQEHRLPCRYTYGLPSRSVPSRCQLNMRIIVSGLIAQHPELGGMTWHYLQYLLGFRALGHDVYYLEDSGEWPYTWDGIGGWNKENAEPNVRYLACAMKSIGFDDRWAYRCALDNTWYGMGSGRRAQVVKAADLLVNVSGSLERPSEYWNVERLVYIDTDPVFTQLALATGDEQRRGSIEAHDVHFTFATDLCAVPSGGLTWETTRQPIALEQWQTRSSPDPTRYTTIMNWTSYKPIQWKGQSYGQKDMEFAQFLDLPKRVPTITLEIALPDLRHASWEQGSDRDTNSGRSIKDTLAEYGWRPVDALTVAGGFASYRDYIVSSRAEWTVAKNGYVRGRCGWFSERSACFLAAGRPVVAQDTGFSSWLPVGEGLLAFATPDESVAAIEALEADYARHCDAAVAIARDYFSATAVLRDLIDVAAARRRLR
jgi:hypothetical protein